uniref:CSON011572 protein n=1 Tax=Culicoides sonorensis TaxID=179676 RepID=A0A336N056_CULSO
IKMEFGVPFITVPTKRTIDGLRGFVYNAMQLKNICLTVFLSVHIKVTLKKDIKKIRKMLNKGFFPLIITIFVPRTTQMASNVNLTNCNNFDYLNNIQGFTSDRMSRGINFISDEHKFLQSKREPRLFSFNTEDDDVN